MEIDVIAESKCGRFVICEVKKTQKKMNLKAITDFQEKVEIYGKILELGGFTEEALEFCQTNGIGTANQIKQY